MAKHTGITIRIGAAYDTVTARNQAGQEIVYDRTQMRKDGNKEMQGALRRTVVDLWRDQHEAGKGKRNQRRANAAKYDRRDRG